MIIKNIVWDVDMDEVMQLLGGLFNDEAALTICLPEPCYTSLTAKESRAYAKGFFEKNPAALYKFLMLPEEVVIPDEISIPEIPVWLSAMYGYSVIGYDPVKGGTNV